MADKNVTPVDLDHLAKYTLGDAALERDFADAFGESCELYLPALEAAQSAHAWKQAAHGLKGAARGIGAFALGDLCEAAEQASAGDDAVRSDLVARIAAAAGAARAFLAARN